MISFKTPPKKPDHFGAAMFATAKAKVKIINEESKKAIQEYETASDFILDDKFLFEKPVIDTLEMINEWADMVYPLEMGYEDLEGKIKTTPATRTKVTAQKYLFFNNAKSVEMKYIPKNMPFYKFEQLMDDLCLNNSLTKIVNRLQLELLKEIKGKIAIFICRKMFNSYDYFTPETIQRKSGFTIKQIKGCLKSLIEKEAVLRSKHGNYYISPTVYENKSNKLIYEQPQAVDWDKWLIEHRKECEARSINYRINRGKVR